MQRFVKEDVLATLTSALKLSKFDVTEKKNHKDASRVDLGFVAKQKLSEAIRKSKLSDRAVLKFKLECKTFLIKTTKKLLEKSRSSII